MKYVCRYLERYEHYMNTIQQYVINDGIWFVLLSRRTWQLHTNICKYRYAGNSNGKFIK